MLNTSIELNADYTFVHTDSLHVLHLVESLIVWFLYAFCITFLLHKMPLLVYNKNTKDRVS